MGTSASQYTCGYRVLDVQPNSPGLQAGLVSFFDFIMKAEDQTFETEGEDLVNLLTRHKNQKLALVVYNTKSRTYREVSIIPSDTWGGDGLLGITIRHDSYQNSENCLRVLEVVKGSPAESAGLTPESDYILGTAIQTFNDATELFELVMDHVDKSLDIYVYNSITDRVALKRLKPTMQWGGEGCLGLDVGQGYLHALPSEARKTNGVACSLGAGTLTSTTGNAAPLPAVGATAAPPPAGNLQRTTREAKVSRRKAAAAASASSTPVKISSPPADSSTAQTSPGSPGLPSSGPISPARLPLAATLSPRSESKRIAGTKTAR